MQAIPLKCHCGHVSGHIEDLTPGLANRLICYCKDCQAFAQHLDRHDSVLDDHGGTEVLQLPIASIKIDQGLEHVKCLRLSSKGLYRWYTECCNTPIGNTVSLSLPFIGVIHSFVDTSVKREQNLGPVYGAVNSKSAKSGWTKNTAHYSEMRTNLRAVLKLISWKFKGLNKPNAFFQENGHAIVKPVIINLD